MVETAWSDFAARLVLLAACVEMGMEFLASLTI
jgi:hypothetical protein